MLPRGFYLCGVAVWAGWVGVSLAVSVITPLPETPSTALDPAWVRLLPPATLLLPKAADYREISQVASVTAAPAASAPAPVIAPPVAAVPAVPMPAVIAPPVVAVPATPTPAPVIAPAPVPTPVTVPAVIAPAPPATPTPTSAPAPVTAPAATPAAQPLLRPAPVAPLPLTPQPTDHPRSPQSAPAPLVPTSTHVKHFFWQVQLMEGREIGALRAYRADLIARYGDLLQNGEPMITMNESHRSFYLHLRRFPSEDSAYQWCDAFRTRGGGESCLVRKIIHTEPSETWQVQIIAKRDLEETRVYRQRLLEKYHALLQDDRLMITTTETGEYFRLRVVAIPTEETAQTLCAALKSSGTDCLVMRNLPPRK